MGANVAVLALYYGRQRALCCPRRGSAMTDVVQGWDAIGANLAFAPAGQGATYTTGSGDVPATQAELQARPGIVRICQDAGATDTTADVLDVENGAATIADVATWLPAARENYKNGARPGQRDPAVYVDRSNLTVLANAYPASSPLCPIPVWVADPDLTMDEAAAEVASPSGPYPVIAVQFAYRGLYDSDAWSADWLADVSTGSGPAPVPAPAPPAIVEVEVTLPEVRQGMTGPVVGTVQILCGRLGHFPANSGTPGDPDDNFGPDTDAAVRDVQAAAHITVDGIVGPQTWPVLIGA